ncbi:MAG: KamA family protein [Bacteroidota bacterium]|nr:KamA family protein [Bacteroidota bacterium]
MIQQDIYNIISIKGSDKKGNSEKPGKKVRQLLLGNLIDVSPKLKEIIHNNDSYESFKTAIEKWIEDYFAKRPAAYRFCTGKESGRKAYENLNWQDFAAIRLYDYIKREGEDYEDLNLRGESVDNRPLQLLWDTCKQKETNITADFLIDFIYLFGQLTGAGDVHRPGKEQLLKWMDRHPSGLDKKIIKIRKDNKDRIIRIFMQRMEEGLINDKHYYFEKKDTREEKYNKMLAWWNERLFHLRFAIRSPGLLNEMLDGSLDEETLKILHSAKNAGIPFFVNPYYLSLLNTQDYGEIKKNTDLAIRDYIIYSKELIDEYGHIVAWEKEDIVEPGKPNAAGWLLPSGHNIHRRYPEVAILIPDTVGRACGGLCVSCQRMYDFQNGHLNFNLDKLQPRETWPQKLKRLLQYYESDSQLRDILITGGDALMSSDKSLKRILDGVYQLAEHKIQANKERPEGEKYAEMLRVRLGTRLPVYLPQRITDDLVGILADFKKKASAIGMKQFVIQTHFETAMEVTPEAKEGLRRLLSAGWIITNQQVFTAAASRRGHTARLRKVLNDVGVMTYYTFTVKGYMENTHNFATNERAVQEQIEEKVFGRISHKFFDRIKDFPHDAEHLVKNINALRKEEDIPFMATDRNVINLPGVGKSLTYRTIGLTHDGRRILEFDHDHTRTHSPIINNMGKVVIIESKSVTSYLAQLHGMDEDIHEYESIFGYSIGETEERMPVYEYPEYVYMNTSKITNLEIN